MPLSTAALMIGVALVGAGYWGPNIANSLKSTGLASLKAICDLDSVRSVALGARHPEARVTRDFEEIMVAPDIDAVVIATPTNTHYDLTAAALRAGKHVLVEKPLATNAMKGERLTALAREHDRILMVGHVFLYNSTIVALKKLIEDGALGDIYYMSFVRTNLGPVRTDVNALWDLATHDVSIMNFLLNGTPKSVSAIGQSFLNRGVEDAVFATYSYANGTTAHIHASWLNPQKVRLLTVVGSRKMAVWNDLDLRKPIRLFDKRVEIPAPTAVEGTYLEHKTMVVDGGSSAPTVALNRPLEAECAHFLKCIAAGERPLTDGRNGIEVIRCLEAATASIRSRGLATTIEAT